MPASKDESPPSNEYVLNIAFFSFLGFCIFQAVFALIAHSQAMLADSEAMTVDALTYLFNLCAERIKKRPLSADELQLPTAVREYRRELRRLVLELVPPSISLATLTAVTFFTIQEAWSTLFPSDNDESEEEDDVSVSLMLIFSGANMLLDVVNVTCFARANSAFGLETVKVESEQIAMSIRRYSSTGRNIDIAELTGAAAAAAHEGTSLLPVNVSKDTISEAQSSDDDDDFDGSFEHMDRVANPACGKGGPCGKELVNLNMCSAWTHVCADTLRSLAVLIAAGIAFVVPAVDGAVADSVAAIAVSIIILVSLLPLLQGLVLTVVELLVLCSNPPAEVAAPSSSSAAATPSTTSIDV